MKRLSAFVVLFMCFLGTIDASASDYHPLLKEGKVWNMYYSNYSRSYELTICVRIIGDTIVDNEQCYKATSETIDRATGNAISEGGSVAVFLEKDRKVFERRNDNWRLLYDFSQYSGDTVVIETMDDTYSLQPMLKATYLYYGHSEYGLKIYGIQSPEIHDVGQEWVVGIGNIGSPLLIGLDRVVGFFSSLFVVEILYIVLLKVLARFGSGNRFNSILFPNHYRKIGWWMLPFSLLLIPLTVFLLLYSFRDKDPQVVEGVYRTTMRLTILLPYIAIMLICLSKEKQEDEFIRHIRARILAYFAIYYMVMSFIITNVSYILMNAINRIALSLESSNRFIAYNVTIGILPVLIWVPVVAVVYALVLKRVLSKNLKESNNEE